MRVVVDTCIIIDVLQKREPFFHNSFEIFKAVAGGRIEGCITAKELCDDMKDFEDAVMSMTAKRIGADFIVTRNIKDYKASPVRAVLPESLKNI